MGIAIKVPNIGRLKDANCDIYGMGHEKQNIETKKHSLSVL